MKIIILISMLVLPIASQAACVRADLTGVWRLYTVPMFNHAVARCTVIIPATGTAIATNSVCTVPGVGNYPVTGNLSIDTYCQVSGTFNIPAASSNNNINAWISRGKDSISGISWFAGNPLGGEVVSGSRQ